MVEPLESRRLLAVTASLDAGTLSILSDHAPDSVAISTDGHGQIVVTANHHHLHTFSAHLVARIAIDMGAGNDAVHTSAGIALPMTIRGGLGNDTLVGGSGHDQIYGDAGDDVLHSRDGRIDTVDGGDGIDSAFVDHVDHVTGVEHVHVGHHHHHHGFQAQAQKDPILAGLLD